MYEIFYVNINYYSFYWLTSHFLFLEFSSSSTITVGWIVNLVYYDLDSIIRPSLLNFGHNLKLRNKLYHNSLTVCWTAIVEFRHLPQVKILPEEN